MNPLEELIASDQPEDWNELDTGETLFLVVRGETLAEFRPLVDDFKSRMTHAPLHERLRAKAKPVRVLDGVKDTAQP